VSLRPSALTGLALAIAGTGLAACGGDKEANLSRSEASAKINSLCRAAAAREQIVTAEDVSVGETAVSKVRANLRVRARLQAQLGKLPLGGSSQPAADFVKAANREVQAIRDFLKAVDTEGNVGAPPVVAALAAAGKAANARADAATAAGLRDCGGSRELEAASSPVGAGSAPRREGADAILPGSGFVGTWEGIATQVGPGRRNLTYPVYMRIDRGLKADRANGGVRYDSFNCLGRVKIVQAGSNPDGFGYRYKLRERILVGRKRCTAGGTITAVTEGDELDWRWRRKDITVVGILRLRDAPERGSPSLDTIRSLQGFDFTGQVTQYGPGGARDTHYVRFGLWPPGQSPVSGYDGWAQYGCGIGRLKLVSVSGDRAVMRETLEPHSRSCIPGGRIETRRVGDKLLWRWFKQADDGKGESQDTVVLGTLELSGPSRGPAPG
jgi:hypothetical protein